MSTYEQVHAGDHVLGYDGDVWGVAAVTRVPQLSVTLVKPGQRVTGYPPPGTPVTILHQSNVRAEEEAAGALIAGGLPVEILGEEWSP